MLDTILSKNNPLLSKRNKAKQSRNFSKLQDEIIVNKNSAIINSFSNESNAVIVSSLLSSSLLIRESSQILKPRLNE